MNIKLLRLVTGEEVIAELKGENNCYELTNPARIGLTEEGLGLAPLSLFSKDVKNLTISREHVVWVIDPEDSIANAYNSQFGSGIILAKSGLV